jgi:hypothetical protein
MAWWMLPPLVGAILALAGLYLTIVASIFVMMIRELAVFATGLPLPRDVDYISRQRKGNNPHGRCERRSTTRGLSER